MGYYDMYVDADTESADVEYDFLTPREVMQALCIGRNTFYRLVNSGDLPAFRIGKLWRVRRSDLEKLVAD